MDIRPLIDRLGFGLESVLDSDERCLALAAQLEGVGRDLARNMDQRSTMFDEAGESPQTFFQLLSPFWATLASSFDPSSSSDVTTSDKSSTASEDSRLSLVLALSKFERNLAAGLQTFQEHAAQHEKSIRQLIFNITTFTRIEDSRFFTLHAVITQCLSNIISPSSGRPGADHLADEYLRLYLSGGRDEDVIIRLLDSRDAKTNTATLHLLNNLVRGSSNRLRLLLDPPGIRWCAKILGRMDDWVELADGRFELGCNIFNFMIDRSLHPDLFSLLSDPSEPLTPSQTTLLKVLDSHLASPPSPPSPSDSDSNTTSEQSRSPNTFLIPLFHTLSLYALSSMRQTKDDPRLPKVFEGLVLLSEGLSSIGLRVQERRDTGRDDADDGDEAMVGVLKKDEEGSGVVKPTVQLLAALNDFFPKVKPAPGSISSSTQSDELQPFANLKRDLIKLLGVLSFEDTAVGDQVREAGGVHLILSMTELDERNPYLREHALFCVRNLMRHNPANQAIIGQMNPVGVLSESGEVLPVPEKMKRSQGTQGQ